jgi:hypothetical protein
LFTCSIWPCHAACRLGEPTLHVWITTRQNPQLLTGRNLLHDAFGLRCMHADGSLQDLLPNLSQQQLAELVEFFAGVLAFSREDRWGPEQAVHSALFAGALAIVQDQLPDSEKRQKLLKQFCNETDRKWQL